VASDSAVIRLVCVDLDGTILDTDEVHFWIADGAVEVLNELGRRGIPWCTNSGRSRSNQLGLVQACRTLEHMPVALLAGEREIYWCHPEFRHHEPFNTQMDDLVRELQPRTIRALAPHMDRLRRTFEFTRDVQKMLSVGWRLADPVQAASLVRELRVLLSDLADAQVLRNGKWVVITHAAVGKSVLLAEASTHLSIARENILAIGDQCNDLDMLDGRVAGCVACPGDADEEVQATVTTAGGYVSGQPGSAGAVEAIRRFVGW